MGEVPRGPRVLYVVYWGLTEPLGRSLVLPAVLHASRRAAVTLLTFEKTADLAAAAETERVRAVLADHAVQWTPLRYHKYPKWPATLFDVLQGVGRGLLESARRRPDVIHARTFIGGIMGATLAAVTGARLVYHAEGSYADEQVDAGVWRRGSLPHRVGLLVERLIYGRADGIVVLSRRAQARVQMLARVKRRKIPVAAVPSCVDLALFSSAGRSSWSPRDSLRLIYVGSIGGRYRFDRVAEFAAAAVRRLGSCSLRVLTPAAPEIASRTLRESGLPAGAWSIGRVAHEMVPAELTHAHAGVHFLGPGISGEFGSPTKIAEYWASGLPVVVSRGMGDVDDIVREERVGVAVQEFSGPGYDRALGSLVELLGDPDLSRRCRRAAERYHGVASAVGRIEALYSLLLPRQDPVEASGSRVRTAADCAAGDEMAKR